MRAVLVTSHHPWPHNTDIQLPQPVRLNEILVEQLSELRARRQGIFQEMRLRKIGIGGARKIGSRLSPGPLVDYWLKQELGACTVQYNPGEFACLDVPSP